MIQNVLKIKNLPFWRGVQSKTVDFEPLPFQLVWDKRGFLRQNIEKNILDKVVNQYAGADYGFITALPGLSRWGSTLGNTYAEFALSAISGRSNLQALEIGGGNDFVARQILDDGKISRYAMVDPAARLDKEPDPRLVVHQKYFDWCDRDMCGPFDLIVTFNCIEHVTDPVDFLKSIRKVLAEDGVAVIVGPATERQLIKGDFNVLLHEHLSYLTVEAVRNLASNAGLKTIKIEKVDDEFRGIFCIEPNIVETSINISPPNWVSDLSRNFDQSLKYAHAAIVAPLRAGETIALHGASNGLSNILFALDLTDVERSRIHLFDGDDSKHGSFLPGLARPIEEPAGESYLAADRLIITAPTYFEPIKNNARIIGWPDNKIFSILPVPLDT